MLTEFVPAMHIDTLMLSSGWSDAEKGRFVRSFSLHYVSGLTRTVRPFSIHYQLKRLRHIVRMLNHCNTSQKDWSTGQILCPRRRSAAPDDTSPEAFDICIIDFAFATQSLGHRALLPGVNDVGSLGLCLIYSCRVESTLLHEIHWHDRDEYESTLVL